MFDYQQIVDEYHFNLEKLLKRKSLPFSLDDQAACIKHLREVLAVGDFFVCEEGGLYDEEHIEFKTYWTTVIRVEEGILAFHNSMMIFWPDACEQPNSIPFIPDNDAWKEVFKKIGPENLNINQYHYCDMMLNPFWLRVFGKTADEMWCGGIVSAHGDKAYGYKSQWEKAGVPFNRGVLIFLLSYTKELGDRPKHETREWVIENYSKYLPMILEAEKEIGLL